MSGKKTHLSQLQMHKQLLIAESELNRVLLRQDYQDLAGDVHDVMGQFKNIGAAVSTAALLSAGFSMFRQKEASEGRKSWLQSIFRTIKWGTSVWLTLRKKPV